MPSLRNFRYAQFNSAIARAALSTYFRSGRSYRLLMGPLRGSRMRYDRSVNFHAILGLWDADILIFSMKYLSKAVFYQRAAS